MHWKKTPPELAATFDKAAPKDPKIVRKPMFGYPALFLNGNMLAKAKAAYFREWPDGRARALKAGAKQFEPMPGRPMKEYVVVPTTDVAKPAALARWIAQAHAYATTLPERTKPVKKITKKATAKKR